MKDKLDSCSNLLKNKATSTRKVVFRALA